VRPETEDGKYVAGEAEFVRTGLLGFLGPGGLVFVCGSRDGLMNVSGRKHNTDDIIATVLAVEPMRWGHTCVNVTSGTCDHHFRHVWLRVTSGTCVNTSLPAHVGKRHFRHFFVTLKIFLILLSSN
jgi:hypothetical protein